MNWIVRLTADHYSCKWPEHLDALAAIAHALIAALPCALYILFFFSLLCKKGHLLKVKKKERKRQRGHLVPGSRCQRFNCCRCRHRGTKLPTQNGCPLADDGGLPHFSTRKTAKKSTSLNWLQEVVKHIRKKNTRPLQAFFQFSCSIN